MAERPRHLTHVVRRNQPGAPNRRNRRDGNSSGGCLILLGFIFGGVILAGVLFVSLTSAAPGVPTATNAAVAQNTPLATAEPTRQPPAGTPTITPEPPLPTSTFLAPSPSPTAIVQVDARPTVMYVTQSGDTLAAIAARFGVNPDDIRQPPVLEGAATTLSPGQLLVIPNVLNDLSPAEKLMPDSEVIFGPSAARFDSNAFAQEQGGYLARYKGFVDNLTRRGGDVVDALARQHSISPRFLLALLEHQGGWVTNSSPSAESLKRPLGYVHPYRNELSAQLNWAANQIEIGYYGWRAGTLTTLTFPDGTQLRMDPTLNAGTAAVQFFFSQLYNRADWEQMIGPNGFPATYRRLFGDPLTRAFDVIPGNLQQPQLSLPFLRGQTWYFSGGPHGAWEVGGAQAALDFAPASIEGGCSPSGAWVTAMAAGQVVRSESGIVVIDLDGDGSESTGWALFYYHIADNERVAVGTVVERGTKIGHPSCQGGRATGTHVHVSRKFNGEWILAGGPVPFNLDGWVAQTGAAEYQGQLVKDGVIVEACTCTAAYTAITAGR